MAGPRVPKTRPCGFQSVLQKDGTVFFYLGNATSGTSSQILDGLRHLSVQSLVKSWVLRALPSLKNIQGILVQEHATNVYKSS